MVAGAAIVSLHGREILDSRGNPTVEAEIQLANGICVTAAAPAGASTGAREAVELRDGGQRLGGRGTRQAAENINRTIATALRGMDARAQEEIDLALIDVDGSMDKSRLGANALLAVSLAAAKAGAATGDMPLHAYLGDGCVMPAPMMNIINGGAHANNNLDIQEFMIMPLGFDNFTEALFAGVEVFHTLRTMLSARGDSTAVGDEGGFAPNLRGGAAEALDLLMEAITRSGYAPKEQISIAMDCAASEFFRDGVYEMPAENFRGDAVALTAMLSEWTRRYPLVSIEDGCAEDDWAGWELLSKNLSATTQLVGDDLFVTNTDLLQKGIERGVATALLAKPNQAGTLTETRQAIQLAQEANYGVVLSHRSGETEYAEIADLAVAFGAGQIKTGAPCRGERVAKYNRLLRLADTLGSAAVWRGADALAQRS